MRAGGGSQQPSVGAALRGQRTAQAAAVLGSGADLRHAAALAELSDETAAAPVEALVRTQILGDEPRLSFVHPVVRAAIYLNVPVTIRAQAHAKRPGFSPRGRQS